MKNNVLCLACAALTGLLFQALDIPHGLLLGSVVGAAVLTTGVGISSDLRFGMEYVQIALGTATGLLMKDWSGEIIAHIIPSLALMLICLIGQCLVAWLWLRKVCKWAPKDALLATYPGALAAILDIIKSEKAENKVIIAHLTRLVFITVTLSLILPPSSNRSDTVQAIADFSHASALAILLTSCIVTGLTMRRIGVPAPFMISAILLTSLLASPLALDSFRMPQWCLDAAAVMLGALIGSKLKGMSMKEIGQYVGAGFVSVSLMLLFAGVVALIFANILEVPAIQLWLAHLPGAIELVALIGYGSGLNVAFILLHHLARMVFLHFAPVLLAQTGRYRRRP
ncbi:AbrB family transcriptional regulator [Pseudomonas guariconensis]|uniref:AbrB family transcriptional regulator n=1 Tax=Pseudomonas guariconensis TaxID=1288410 RepID=UPI0018ABAF41|nr:AbrB family transcriptional regulator [Pseudomonas guariconensis]MBF8740603.1 AbrB family transcriptional regulator [Pseudomonas guariconensis]MBF8750830.1 AbrB family transcriptional regulator [Pseudomonas guariconensis]